MTFSAVRMTVSVVVEVVCRIAAGCVGPPHPAEKQATATTTPTKPTADRLTNDSVAQKGPDQPSQIAGSVGI